MAIRRYATKDEFKEFLGLDEAPSDADSLLQEASEEIDEILLASVYPTDANFMPTQPLHVEAMKLATLVQARHRREHGDEVTISTSGGSMSLGPLSFGGVAGGNTSADHQGIPQVPERVFRVLNVAGMLTTKSADR